MKIDWKRKLTSRKFWLAIVGFITSLLYAFNYSHIEVEKIVGVVTAASVVIAYLIGEGLADSSDTYYLEMSYPDESEEEE